MSCSKLARFFTLALVPWLLFPVARSAAPLQSGPSCNGGIMTTETYECPGYAVVYTGVTQSLDGCSGCKIDWTATVIDLATGNPVRVSTGTDEATCGEAATTHTLRCPGGGLLESFSLSCNTCQ
jgi:hypothetical protein